MSYPDDRSRRDYPATKGDVENLSSLVEDVKARTDRCEANSLWDGLRGFVENQTLTLGIVFAIAVLSLCQALLLAVILYKVW